MTKYTIMKQAVGIGADVDVYSVTSAGKTDVSVWHDTTHDRVNCTACSGPLSAMLSTCKHANALKRHLKNIAKKGQP